MGIALKREAAFWALALFAVGVLLAGCERAATEPQSQFTPAAGIAVATPVITSAPTVIRPAATGSPVAPASAVTSVPLATAPRVATLPPTPTSTPVRPTATATSVPPTSTPTRVISGPTMKVKVYVIAEGDAGKSGPKIGCDDSAVAIDRVVPQSTAVLTSAMKALVSIKDRVIGESGLYNALYQSNLSVESVTLSGTKATVRLTGKTVLGGTCDTPRVIAQIRFTALQFATVRDVAVFLNGVPIDQALSQR